MITAVISSYSSTVLIFWRSQLFIHDVSKSDWDSAFLRLTVFAASIHSADGTATACNHWKLARTEVYRDLHSLMDWEYWMKTSPFLFISIVLNSANCSLNRNVGIVARFRFRCILCSGEETCHAIDLRIFPRSVTSTFRRTILLIRSQTHWCNL